jgi:molybdate transport system regulatory protein
MIEDTDIPLLNASQLNMLEAAFRKWAHTPCRRGHKGSRLRILLLFLLIRYTGAKLNEMMTLKADAIGNDTITFGGGPDQPLRIVEISGVLSTELRELLASLGDDDSPFAIDPAFLLRKFYEITQQCGFGRRQGGPEMLRKARALELMQNNVPLPAVQRLMGYTAPPLTAAAVGFTERELREETRNYVDREGTGKTSARNSFTGKVHRLRRGSVQTLVELVTADGEKLRSIVTNESAARLALRPGRLVTAEVKAPWLNVEHAARPGSSSADNERTGTISRIVRGSVTTECIVAVAPTLNMCAIVPSAQFEALGLAEGDAVRLTFGSFSVILRVD